MKLKWLLFKLAFLYPRIYAFLSYYRNKRRRREIEEKFDLFLPKGWDFEKGREVVKHIFELKGSRKVMRYLIPLMDDRIVKRFVKIEGLHYLDQALKKKRGIVLMAGHLGNPHLGFHTLRVIGYDFTLIKGGAPREPAHRKFRYSETPEDTIFIYDPLHSASYKKRILEILQSGGIINYYGDTREGSRKEIVSFMGRQVGFSTGMIHLAHQAGAAIIPFIHLYQRGRITLIFKEPIDHEWKAGEGEYRRIVTEFAELLETYLVTCPEQYMGVYGPTVMSDYYRSYRNHHGTLLDKGKA